MTVIVWATLTRSLTGRLLAAACLVVVLGITVTLYAINPDRPLREIERKLARGETVTLIGPNGKPQWSHWR